MDEIVSHFILSRLDPEAAMNSLQKYLTAILTGILLALPLVSCQPTEESHFAAYDPEASSAAETRTTEAPPAPDAASSSAQENKDGSSEHVFLTEEPLEERPRYVWLEERGEYAGYLYRQFLQNPQKAAWGPDGLYIADGSGKHIVRVAPDGTLDDLGIWKNHIYMQEYGSNRIAIDPAGNLFFISHLHLYRRTPDGDIDYLFTSEYDRFYDITIDETGTLYYSLNVGDIYQWNPDGKDILLTQGFTDPLILAGPAGQLYIIEGNGNQVFELDTNTKKTRLLYEGNFGPSGGGYLAVDNDGDIWIQNTNGLLQLSPEGELKPFTIDGQRGEDYRGPIIGGIVFDPEDNLWITSATGLISRLIPVDPGQPDPDAFISEIFQGTFNAYGVAVGPEGNVYATNQVPGNVWKFAPDGSYEIIWEYGDQGSVGIAVSDDQTVYAGSIFGEILKWEKGEVSHYAYLESQTMVMGGDGYLYVVSGPWTEEQQIVRVPAQDTIEVVATEIDGAPFGIRPVQIAPAMDDGLYVINQTNGTLYYMDFSGEGYMLEKLGEELAVTIMTSSPVTGKVYFLAHLTPDHTAYIERYTLYEYEPGGELKVVSPQVPGDPIGMDVSPDGKWLYLIATGTIDKIPLDVAQP